MAKTTICKEVFNFRRVRNSIRSSYKNYVSRYCAQFLGHLYAIFVLLKIDSCSCAFDEDITAWWIIDSENSSGGIANHFTYSSHVPRRKISLGKPWEGICLELPGWTDNKFLAKLLLMIRSHSFTVHIPFHNLLENCGIF